MRRTLMLVQFLLRLLFRPLRVLTLTLPRLAILLQVVPYIESE